MEVIKSKGMVIFFVIIMGLTLISSINTKRIDSKESLGRTYVMNLK